MTTASPTTTNGSLDFSTSEARAFLTGAEIREIEADPVLTVREILAYRADPDPEPPKYDCLRCHRETVNSGGICADCAYESEGGR